MSGRAVGAIVLVIVGFVVLATIWGSRAACPTFGAVCAPTATPVVKPCLTLEPPPAASGSPSESDPSWCVNSTATLVERMYVQLSIIIGGSSVSIPGGIGELSPERFGYACSTPVLTDNSSGDQPGSSGGIVEIASPWNFTYTLGDLFDLWAESFHSVVVNGVSEPVFYDGAQVFNYTTNSDHAVRLWVDGTQVATGAAQVLNYELSSYDISQTLPTCYVDKYGTGHTVTITWGWVGAPAP